MATRFYLPVGGSPPTSPAFTSSWESSASAQRWPAVRSKSNTALTQYVKRFPSTTSQQMLFHQWISETLDSDQTISGTMSMVVKTYEGNAAVDGHLAFVLKVMQGDSTTLVRGTLLQYHTTSTEKTTAWQTRIHSARAITTVNALAGDRIVIEIGSHGVTPSTSYDDGLKFGDPSATNDYALTSGLTTDLCPWVELSATLTFGTPSTNYDLTATGITAGVVVGTPTAAQNHTLAAPAAITFTPALATAGLSQNHVLGASSLTVGTPGLGMPSVTVFENYSLTADGLAGGSPATGTPAVSQVHALTGDGQTIAPEAGSPAVSQNQVLAGDGVATGAPALGGPAVSQAHLFTANVMAAGAPALGEPLVAQLHQMVAGDLETGTPTLGTPTIGGASHELTADGLTFGAELDETTLAQIHALVVNGIIAGPETGEPEISQIHSLLAHEITGSVLLSESYIVVPPPPKPSRTFVRMRRSMVRQARRAVTRNKLRMVR